MESNKVLIKQFLEKIRANKKYKSISEEVVKKEIKSHLKSNPKTTHPTKQDIKEIRAKLHRLYSSYQTKKKKKSELYLEELKNNINNKKKVKEITNKLLSLTLSTKERLNDYQLIYNQIFKTTGKPKTIIDLGAGLNPLSFPLMNLTSLNYHTYDIDQEDIKFLNQYFKIIKKKFPDFKGKAEILDVRNLDKIKQLPESDVVFMFKLLDLINTKKKKISGELIRLLINKTKYIIISFATKTLTRKPMKLRQRTGFENYLKENNLQFKKFKIENEIFYIIYE